VEDFALKCTVSLLISSTTAPPGSIPYSPFFRVVYEGARYCPLKVSYRGDGLLGRSAILVLRKYIMTCHTPFEGTPLRGLQILGFLEPVILNSKVFVLDKRGHDTSYDKEDTCCR
jgi:hypothetical protein